MFLGVWDIVIGQFFYQYESPVHLIKSRELPKEWKRMGGLDYGNCKALEIVCMDYMGNCYAEWEYSVEPTIENPSGYTASEFGEGSAEFMLSRGIGEGLVVLGDTNMWSAVGKDVGSTRVPAYIIQAIWKKKFDEAKKKSPILIPVSKRGTEEYRYRIACNEAVKDYLLFKRDEYGKVIKEPRLYIFDRCQGLADEFGELQADPADTRDIADDQHDHRFDGFKMPFFQIVAPKTPLPAMTAEQEWAQEAAQLDKPQRGEYIPTGDWRVDI
jgi:hypothetical protein